jgi:hypothetical protein
MNEIMVRRHPVILTSNISLWEIFFVLSKELIDFNALIEIVERFLWILTKIIQNTCDTSKPF